MTHEFDGEKYQLASAHQLEWGQQLVAELALNGNERVLDLGCGDGSLTAYLAELLPNGEVLGIDASQGMLETALTQSKPNLSFCLMDIDNLDFGEPFDLIFSNAALHWVKDHPKLLNNSYDLLTEQGKIRFNFAGDGNCSNFYAVVREVMQFESFRESFTRFEWPWYMPSVRDYQALAESSGFRSIQVWGENADRYFANSRAMIQWLDQPSLVPFLAVLPKQKQAEFRHLVIEKMINKTIQEDGRCFETFRRINLQAQK